MPSGMKVRVLPDEHSRDMCLRFADMESKLGEIGRARAISSYCSQKCDPRVTANFWQTWSEFEILHGNEDTIREMLRTKGSVQATYNTVLPDEHSRDMCLRFADMESKLGEIDRARAIYSYCSQKCDPRVTANFWQTWTIYLLYAKLEEQYGLMQRIMAVYERATQAVEPKERHLMFNIYIKRTAAIYGVTRTRAIYQEAIEVLPDGHSRDMCLRFADMERKLGEIDRVRAIYSYCSQMCDPRMTANFWQTWKEFEVQHGNEDTIREMLRIKRSVQATYNTQVNFMSSQMLKATTSATGQSGVDDMMMLEQKAQQLAGEAEKDKPKLKEKILFVRSDASRSELAELAKQTNPDEIDINDEEGDGEPDEMQIEQKSIPTAVFGGLKDN